MGTAKKKTEKKQEVVVYRTQKDIPPDMRDNWKTAKDLLLHHWETWGNAGKSPKKPVRTSFILAFQTQLDPLLHGTSRYMKVMDHLLDNQRNKKQEEEDKREKKRERKKEEKKEEKPALGFAESSGGGRNLSSLDLRCPSKELLQD